MFTRKNYLILAVIVIAIAIAFGIWKFFSLASTQPGDYGNANSEKATLAGNGQGPQTSASDGVGNVQGEENTQTGLSQQAQQQNAGTNEGSSSSSSSSGSSTNSNPQCEQQISYSIENTSSVNNCLAQEGDVCTQRQVVCTAYVHNFDSSVSGVFGLKINFFAVDQGPQNIIASAERSANVPAGALTMFQSTQTFESTGQDGLANKEISCVYQTTHVPTRNIC